MGIFEKVLTTKMITEVSPVTARTLRNRRKVGSDPPFYKTESEAGKPIFCYPESADLGVRAHCPAPQPEFMKETACRRK